MLTTGVVPEQLSKLTKLEKLSVRDNDLESEASYEGSPCLGSMIFGCG